MNTIAHVSPFGFLMNAQNLPTLLRARALGGWGSINQWAALYAAFFCK